jgi:hypothetical protein
MLVKTILNRVQKQPGFVYGAVRFVEARGAVGIEVEIRRRVGGRPTCSGCARPGPGYDTLPARRFEFVPLWGLAVFFSYAMRRVECRSCGVRVETVPWAEGKHHLTTTYAWFLARWAKRLSWTEVAEAFRTTWEHVFHSVEMAVAWGRDHCDLTGITAIGIDEIQWQRGHKYQRLENRDVLHRLQAYMKSWLAVTTHLAAGGRPASSTIRSLVTSGMRFGRLHVGGYGGHVGTPISVRLRCSRRATRVRCSRATSRAGPSAAAFWGVPHRLEMTQATYRCVTRPDPALRPAPAGTVAASAGLILI